MSRVPTANYTADVDTGYQYATSDDDQYDRELDISYVARALERHTHAAGRGLAVVRVANGSIVTVSILDGAITGSKIATGVVDGTKIPADAITATHIVAGGVGASEIVDGGVGTTELADGSVTTIKLFDQSVTAPKIANSTITNTQLAAGAAVANIGYTPINKAADTGLGDMTYGSTKRIIFTQEAADKILYAAAGAYKVSVGSGSLEWQTDTTFKWRNDTDSVGTYAAVLDADAKTFSISQLISTIANGTAPLVVTSSTQVANLNSAQVAGKVPTATPAANALPLADSSGKLDSWVTAAASSYRPGDIRTWMGTSGNLAAELASNGGWLECDGTAVSRSGANTALFGKISTICGAGDGSTTFNLPDLKDRSVVGKSSTKAAGATGGASTVNFQHQHAGTTGGASAPTSGGSNAENYQHAGSDSIASNVHGHNISVSTALDLSNVQSMYHPYQVAYILIKL